MRMIALASAQVSMMFAGWLGALLFAAVLVAIVRDAHRRQQR